MNKYLSSLRSILPTYLVALVALTGCTLEPRPEELSEWRTWEFGYKTVTVVAGSLEDEQLAREARELDELNARVAALERETDPFEIMQAQLDDARLRLVEMEELLNQIEQKEAQAR